MSSLPNLLQGIVRDENAHTKLLYNLMQIDEFRRPVLSLLFESKCCASALYSDIETQKRLDNACGCADLLLDNPDVSAILEVKLLQSCGLTENQPEGYIRFLSVQRRTERALTFLVPKRWTHRNELQLRLNGSKDRRVTTRIVEWEDLIALLESDELRSIKPISIVSEFTNLLSRHYRTRPVNFSSREAEMLFSKETAASVSKLYKLIEKIRTKSDGYRQTGQRSDPHGIYFHNSDDEEIFWIGNWPEFWRETGNPLAFGVSKTSPPNVNRAFVESYKGTKMAFSDGNGEYTVGWASEDDLSGSDAVETVWTKLAPVLEAVTRAGERANSAGR